ncbi:MAG: LPS assembly lipoprotein LptE [Nevskiales bacterium]
MRLFHFALALLLLASSACGFQLQGQRELAPELRSVSVDFQAKYQVLQPPLVRALRERIERHGGNASDIENSTRLRISTLEERVLLLSVNAAGEVIEYLYTTTVGYELIDAGRIRVPYRTLSVSREYSFNSREVLATEAEAEQLRAQMQSELAELILLQLEAELHKS